jgi:hypothetical protein
MSQFPKIDVSLIENLDAAQPYLIFNLSRNEDQKLWTVADRTPFCQLYQHRGAPLKLTMARNSGKWRP